MGTFFSKIGSMLGKGLQTGVNTFMLPYSITKKAVTKVTSSFFPTAQKTVITNDQVSSQPYTTFLGYRPQIKGATTLGDEYQSWWSQMFESGRKLWDNFRTSFMGYSWKDLGKKSLNTLGQVAEQTSQKVIQTLPDYFMTKWGLTNNRIQDEYATNNQSTNPQGYPIIYLDSTQSRSAATESSGIMDFFRSAFGTQPRGEYSIAFPQQEAIPIPVSIPAGSEKIDSGGLNWTPILYIIGIFAALFLLYNFLKGK